MTQKKRILVVATGGTIACKRSEAGLKPVITSNELLSFVPDTARFCQADAVQVLNIDSTNIQPAHWLLMARTIEDRYGDYDGFVICHGTDTMAYTAAALSYLIQGSQKPIVITGAQKPIDLEITDAKTNLSDSLLFASCERAHGVNIVFDGKVIAGTRGKKERTKSYNAFSSINFPYIAAIRDGRIFFYLDDKEQTAGPVRFYRQLNDPVHGRRRTGLHGRPLRCRDHRILWRRRHPHPGDRGFPRFHPPLGGIRQDRGHGHPGHQRGQQHVRL